MGMVLIVGISGAGKTTLLKRIPEKYLIYNAGSLMLDIAKAENLASDRDGIKKLDLKTSTALREEAFKKLAELHGNIIVDTHITVENAEKSLLTTGIEFSLASKLPVLGLIYIDAPSREIFERRQTDAGMRSRESQTEEDLDKQRVIDLSVLSYYMTYLNIPLYIINNRQGRLDEAASKLNAALLDLFGE